MTSSKSHVCLFCAKMWNLGRFHLQVQDTYADNTLVRFELDQSYVVPLCETWLSGQETRSELGKHVKRRDVNGTCTMLYASSNDFYAHISQGGNIWCGMFDKSMHIS